MKSLKLKKKSKINFFEALFMVLFFLGIFIWISFSFKKINATNTEEQLNETKQSIQKCVVLCYSLEGNFPPDIQYLKDNYGLIINDDKYIVHYDVFASNIMPDIAVFPRN